jgi:hypothetical protein
MAIEESLPFELVELTSTQTVTGTTYTNVLRTSTGMKKGHKYMVMVRAQVTSDSTTNGEGVKCRLYNAGNAEAVSETEFIINPQRTDDYQLYAMTLIIDSPSDSGAFSDLELQIAGEAAGIEGKCIYASLAILDISELVEGVDYVYKFDTTRTDNTASFVTQASVNVEVLDGNQASGDWLFFVNARFDVGNTNNQKGPQLQFTGGTSSEAVITEAESTGDTLSMQIVSYQDISDTSSGSDTTHTFNLQTKDTAAGLPANAYLSGMIFGMRLDSLRKSAQNDSQTAITTTATVMTDGVAATLPSITAGTTQDYLVVGYHRFIPASTGRSSRARIKFTDDSGSSYPVDSAGSTNTINTSHDGQDELPTFFFAKVTQDGDEGTTTVTTQFSKESSANYGCDDFHVAAIAVNSNAYQRNRYTWNGTTSTDMLTPANWSLGGVTATALPTAQDDLIFNSGSNNASSGHLYARGVFVADGYSGGISSGCKFTTRKMIINADACSIKSVVAGKHGWKYGADNPARVYVYGSPLTSTNILLTCTSDGDKGHLYVRDSRSAVSAGGSGWDKLVQYGKKPTSVSISASIDSTILCGQAVCTSTSIQSKVVVSNSRARYTQDGGLTSTIDLWDGNYRMKNASGTGGTWNIYGGYFDMTESANRWTPVTINLWRGTLNTKGGIDVLTTPSSAFNSLHPEGRLVLDNGRVIAVT